MKAILLLLPNGIYSLNSVSSSLNILTRDYVILAIDDNNRYLRVVLIPGFLSYYFSVYVLSCLALVGF